MPHRSHLFSLRIAHALRESCLKVPYTPRRLAKDVGAGITVGIIAIPLAMALAIASGVAPQHGLYTAMIAGFVIALTGGSRYSVSGPTAAFVVILFPVAQQFGLGGLLVATLMAGLMLVGFAVGRLGRLIEYVPEPVTLGFTGGIAIVIATLQVRDLFGLSLAEYPDNWLGKIAALGMALPSVDWATTLVGTATLAVLLYWPRLRLPLPGHLAALLVGVLVALLLAQAGHPVETIGTRFSFSLADGTTGQGIPAILPEWVWPWQQPGPDGQPIDWSLATWQALLSAAFSIAVLGAIESLLCAVVLDGMTGTRHSANSELLGQGIGNLVVPFFGGITATAAIARSAANVRAGAESPVAALVHALVVMAALLALAGVLSYLPMASLAALLLMVAWNMSEAPKAAAIVRKAPLGDVLVLGVCLSLTVLFDMVIAITAGIVLAALLFMREISHMTKVTDTTASTRLGLIRAQWLPLQDLAVFKVNGPLFFAAAERIFAELLAQLADKRVVVLNLEAVTVLDAGGLSALSKFIDACGKRGIKLIIANLQFQPLRTLAKAKMGPVRERLLFAPTLDEAIWFVQSEAALRQGTARASTE
ncbi:transporter [Candidatus Tenderia electrophaga]|jgi:SulP family sulfate permease|uniref:Transporter n=1 Tax=Candidatus Tenderia electrophaga TaxID=1748243 RepID=A0A0S2TD12_9GAMM|nr:transporter [Candidatus Tenderia electrophaga]